MRLPIYNHFGLFDGTFTLGLLEISLRRRRRANVSCSYTEGRSIIISYVFDNFRAWVKTYTLWAFSFWMNFLNIAISVDFPVDFLLFQLIAIYYRYAWIIQMEQRRSDRHEENLQMRSLRQRWSYSLSLSSSQWDWENPDHLEHMRASKEEFGYGFREYGSLHLNPVYKPLQRFENEFDLPKSANYPLRRNSIWG